MKNTTSSIALRPLGWRLWITALLALSALSATTANARPSTNDTFVHLFEWRWSDIATECEQHLGPKGFSAVQVSPPQEHIQGAAWWTRYQPVSLSIDNSRSGTRTEFIDMVNRCESAGVDIYVDAIINHMAAGNGVGSDGTPYSDGTSYPAFSSNDFHPNCAIDGDDYGNDAWAVRHCRLVGLPDLKTGDDYVRQTLADYMNDLIAIGVKGFRLDASKHMSPEDINAITNRLNGNPYIFQEVIDLGGEAVSALEYLGGGDVTEFKYSAELGNQFKNGRLSYLRSFGEAWGFLDQQAAVVFTDNHDNQRGHGAGGSNVLTYKDGPLYELANVFMLAWPYGYPKVMSSYDFSDSEAGPPSVRVHEGEQLNCYGSAWKCEHRWQPIANMAAFRQATSDNPHVTDWWDNGNNQIAFGRGDAGFIVINRDGSHLQRTFNTQLPEGEYCNVVEGNFISGANSSNSSNTYNSTGEAGGECTGETLSVDSQGRLNVSVPSMTALAIHKNAVVGPIPPSTQSSYICYDNAANYINPHIYYWSPDTAGALEATSWPGKAMHINNGFYCFDAAAELNALNIVFNDNGGAQSADLAMLGDQTCYQHGRWTSLADCGIAPQ